MHFTHLTLLVSLLCCGVSASASANNCTSTTSDNPLGTRIAEAALNEYYEFNGHRINADGYLWKSGSAESETEPLVDPDSGYADENRSGRFAWRRVWDYWLALDKHIARDALSRKVISVPGLLENPGTTYPPDEIRLSDLFSSFTAQDTRTEAALKQAAVRAALNDSPWSAAFISYLMDRVQLTGQQFRYSPAHWQYIQRAFEEPGGYAYKACDPRVTTPRIGDLLCYSRGKAPLKNFAQWQNAVKAPDFSAASHCEVVIDVDLDAKKMELVGGNVLQSVARRKLKLNAENMLSASHDPERTKAGKNRECLRDKTCDQQDLNSQYWAVLLRLQ